ncbi:MAG: hypothetical protein SGBAC_000458 [Bacillariaceae sp.]
MPAMQETRKEKIPIMGRNSCFPLKVHEVLHYATTNNLESIICWSGDGKGFYVLNSNEFMNQIAPHFFPNQARFRSFERLLNIWGFERPYGRTAKRFWCNANFQRNRPDLCRYMVRIENKGTKKRASIGPNSYVFVKSKVPGSEQQLHTARKISNGGTASKKEKTCQTWPQQKDTQTQFPRQKRATLAGEPDEFNGDKQCDEEACKSGSAQSPQEMKNSGVVVDETRKVARRPICDQQDEDTRLAAPQEKLQRWLQSRKLKAITRVAMKRSSSKQHDDMQLPGPHQRLQRWLETQAIESTAGKRNGVLLKSANAASQHLAQTAAKERPILARRRILPTKARSEQQRNWQKLASFRTDFSSRSGVNRATEFQCQKAVHSLERISISNGMLSKESSGRRPPSLVDEKNAGEKNGFGRLLQSSCSAGQQKAHIVGQFDDALVADSLLALAGVAMSECDKKDASIYAEQIE